MRCSWGGRREVRKIEVSLTEASAYGHSVNIKPPRHSFGLSLCLGLAIQPRNIICMKFSKCSEHPDNKRMHQPNFIFDLLTPKLNSFILLNLTAVQIFNKPYFW